ncbi:MAG: tRNA pseudouridine(13) synthase TruD [Thermoprotei archaeon]|nr:MAG: tRNA pseudouridine(13) synthase TruD [Thermoprotei archaeon]
MKDMYSFLRTNSELDVLIGMEYYVTSTPPIRGKLRKSPEDFQVFEVSRQGIIAINVKGLKVLYDKTRGLYAIYILSKSNIPFNTMLSWLKSEFGTNNIGMAGIKDTRAVSHQFISIPLSDKVRDNILKSESDGRYIALSFVGFSPKGLSVGGNLGNIFKITIREVNVTRDVFKNVFEKLMHEIRVYGGLPNYFGYQRFGTIRPNTHIIGRYILLGDYEAAIMELLLSVYPHESPRSKEAREFLKETMDFKRALNRFPPSLKYERIVIKYLSRHRNDYKGALLRLPQWLRKLFIEAYQSYIFNKLVSYRLSLGIGLNEVIHGDNVFLLSSGYVRKAERDSDIDELQEYVDLGLARIELPLVGYATPINDTRLDEMLIKILEEEGIDLKLFKEVYPIAPPIKGTLRPLSCNPLLYDFSINDDTVTVTFFMPSGSYATVFLREVLKPRDPFIVGL